MIIRYFENEDRENFLSMCRAFFDDDTSIIKPYDEKMSALTFDTALSRQNNLWGYVFQLEEGAQPVGYALVSSFWCNDEGGRVLVFDELYIDGQYRCMGIASVFIEWLQKEWKNRAAAIVLDILEGNARAKQLFEHEGFRRDDYISYIKYLS